MSRSVSLRRVCSHLVSQRIEEALRATVYIVHQAGPTGFVLKQGESKFKVFLGNAHTCTCSVFKKEKELCIHILWLLLKKFRIPKNHSVVFQLGLVEREIHEILSGYLTRQEPTSHGQVMASASCDQRPITLGDVCPICQNDLLGKPQKLSYCKYGCGKSVHLKCIKLWAEHQKSQGERALICPLCREKFSTFEELHRELYSSKGNWSVKEPLHYGITCSQCGVCPIPGKCYKCMSCRSFYLCNACFTGNHHLVHSFHFQTSPGDTWRTAAARNTTEASDATSIQTLSQSLVNDLQTRELSASDYDLLLSLDSTNTNNMQAVTTSSQLPHTPAPPPRRIPNHFRIEPLDHGNPLLISGAFCEICCEQFQRGEWIRKLPCKHKFHRTCIDTWLNQEEHTTCPIDGKNLYNSTEDALVHQYRHHRRQCLQTNSISGTRRTGHIYHRQMVESRDPAMELGILGHSLAATNREPIRPQENTAHRTLATIRKGSAIQHLRSAAHSGRNNTAYFDLHVTPIFGSQTDSETPRYEQSPPLLRATATAGQAGRRSFEVAVPTMERMRTARKQPLVGSPTSAKPPIRGSKLPKITQNRVDVNSFLRVSSLSSSLPPITTSHNVQLT